MSVTETSSARPRRLGAGIAISQVVAAFLTAIAIAGLIMLLSGIPVGQAGAALFALAEGSLGSVAALSETMVAATPLIIAGLGFVFGARAGLFNVGIEGQILFGGLCGAVAGFALDGLPMAIHLPLSLAIAAAGGALWASLAGILKVTSGAHEVITTIMMNFIALRLIDYLLRNPPIQNPGRSDPVSRNVLDSAVLPRLLTWYDSGLRLDLGFILALALAVFAAWLLFRSVLGFEIRVTGFNAKAAKVAGIGSARSIIIAMMLSGAVAGLAGATLTQGVLGRVSPDYTAGLGFVAIAVALLGRGHPGGVVAAGILFGALEAGGRRMQFDAGVSIDLIGIVQAVVLLFIAAPIMIRRIYPFLFNRSR